MTLRNGHQYFYRAHNVVFTPVESRRIGGFLRQALVPKPTLSLLTLVMRPGGGYPPDVRVMHVARATAANNLRLQRCNV
ncbi:MAG: hypothetical protein GIW97_01345 [Candidatus Eremiobacteraeota bacterium]|nr:hypothetical protein [Candidatus Eremiobacteraeota bacterium]